jgi:hypothetical protein
MAREPINHAEHENFGRQPVGYPSNAQAPATDPVKAALHARTEKGELELRTRQHGLSPRARQLLLLIDRRRDRKRLARVFPAHELTAYLALLESQGFICLERAASPDSSDDPLESLRDRALSGLIDILGIPGEFFALRVAKCKSKAEIEALIPAMESIIEVTRGREQASQFSRTVLVP